MPSYQLRLRKLDQQGGPTNSVDKDACYLVLNGTSACIHSLFCGCFQKLKARARGISPDIRQIDLDVNRTYRDHIMFMHRYDVKWVLSHFTASKQPCASSLHTAAVKLVVLLI